jgi:hypothetical protein
VHEKQNSFSITLWREFIHDCIDKHVAVLNEYGYCWFGKIGRSPSTKVINSVLVDGVGTVILYSRAGIYIYTVKEVSKEKPEQAYPSYYETHIFTKGIIPSMYFKLTNIEVMDAGDLSKYVVLSSKNNLPNTLNKSMNSFFVTELRGIGNINEKATPEKVQKKRENLDVKDCYYRKYGKCNRKSFVNYQYECIHPDLCIKQKR